MFEKIINYRRSDSSNQRELNAAELLELIDKQRLPKHVAIIMDGNGRWAQKRGMPRALGHRAGVESLRDIVELCCETGIGVLTVYAFSTENWKRPREEIIVLMDLLVEYLQKEVKKLHREGVRINPIGRVEDLPQPAVDAIAAAVKLTGNNNRLVLNVALNYGGRMEIIDAVRAIAEGVESGQYRANQVDAELFANYLYTAGLPEPDLLIRPSGDYRISNFLLWQLAYTEFWFTDTLWPEFRRKDMLRALVDFQSRDRRFGGLNYHDNQ
ncbi:MAG: isoprenyl transferase [Peptococcaceae bacterium]|nr:isoprenyl transferase [Peptococcaceae bacterium]